MCSIEGINSQLGLTRLASQSFGPLRFGTSEGGTTLGPGKGGKMEGTVERHLAKIAGSSCLRCLRHQH